MGRTCVVAGWSICYLAKSSELVPRYAGIAVDMIMANFLVNEGLVDDALNLLVRFYPEKKTDFNYLTLLGKAAARAGEFQTAVGAFERAYKLSPRSKKGREVLFQAAYLSYQFQDYDGAVRKFDQFVKHSKAHQQDGGQLLGTRIEKAQHECQLLVSVMARTSEDSIVTNQLREK